MKAKTKWYQCVIPIALAALLCVCAFSSIHATQEEITTRYNELKPSFSSSETPYKTKPSITSPYAAGKLKQAYLQDGVNMLNFVRFLAGMPDDVTLTDAFNTQSQYGAVLSAASGEKSHTPSKPSGMAADFYNTGLGNTSKSNLYFYSGKFFSLTDSVKEFMYDSNSSNISIVGHRRWVLNPTMKHAGFGQADGRVSLYVQDTSRSKAPDYDAICWPNGPAFPKEFFEGDTAWSVSLNPKIYKTPSKSKVKISLSNAAGKTWNFSASTKSSKSGNYFNVDTQYYGVKNCIIFRPSGISDYSDTYTVKISGIQLLNGTSTSLSYKVKFFSLNA